VKRSEINAAIRRTESALESHNLALPDFARFDVAAWKAQNPAEWREVFACELGWDVTDFGSGDFAQCGLTLVTLRNGRVGSPVYGKPYAEKAMLVGVGQITPLHFHFQKTEDIINRGGGDLVMSLNHATPEEGLDHERPVAVAIDGRRVEVPAGGHIRLKPGQSVCLTPYVYHSFWGEREPVLAWEVSAVNDDHKDNRFIVDLPRFSTIDEDEAPLHPLCNEYAALGIARA
jgi:D-lyxose ketol-isomerase